MTTPERFKRIEALFHRAVDLAPAERRAFLDGACADDPTLCSEVESLLAEADRTQTPLLGRIANAGTAEFVGPGDRIGRYRILRLVGEGGMGQVFQAEQEEPVRRTVALKLIKWGMDTRRVVSRFESERQALALMEHPCIARVHDAGATERGRPYFVMEYVSGITVTEYCDENVLSVVERLDLFLQVCEALQHAHQRGIIHRDLKPSNILVSEQDGRPVPKVIDFGIAKATAMRLTGDTVLTELGEVVGTPDYMSPEQADLAGLDVDTRSDVYTLGVILYELLVGVLPFDRKGSGRTGIDEIRRQIREDDPRRPSSRLMTLGRERAAIADRRATDGRTLARRLSGDLDWITMKALEKDRERRYESAAALAQDIRCHLADQPVSAGPPGAAYRLRKFARRNRALVAGVAAVAIVLLAGAIVSLSFAVREARQRALAEQRFEDVRKLASTFLFEVDDSIAEIRGTTAARETIVATGLAYLDSLAEQAGGERSLLRDVARGYFKIAQIQGVPGTSNLGNRSAAAASVTRGFALVDRLLASDPDDTGTLLLAVKGHIAQAGLALFNADSDSAIDEFNRALAIRERVNQLDPTLRLEDPRLDAVHLRFGTELGLLQRFKEAYAHYDEAGRLISNLIDEFPDDDGLRVGLAYQALYRAQDLANEGKFEEALEPARSARDLFAEHVATSPERADLRNDLGHSRAVLGRTLGVLGKVDEGRDEMAEAIRDCEALVQDEPNNAGAQTCLAVAHSWMGGSYFFADEFADALRHFESMLASYRAILAMDPDSRQARRKVAVSMDEVGKTLVKVGRTEEGLAFHLQAKDVIVEMAGRDPDNVDAQRSVAVSYYYLGELYLSMGQGANGTPEGVERIAEAREAFVASRTVLETLKEKGLLAARDEPVIDMLTSRIQVCDGDQGRK